MVILRGSDLGKAHVVVGTGSLPYEAGLSFSGDRVFDKGKLAQGDTLSWRGVFGSSSVLASVLDYFPLVLVDGESIAVPSAEIVCEGEKLWANFWILVLRMQWFLGW